MEEIKVEKLVNRDGVAKGINKALDTCVNLLEKDGLVEKDYQKLKVLKIMAPHVKTGVDMIRSEDFLIKMQLIQERLKKNGYTSSCV